MKHVMIRTQASRLTPGLSVRLPKSKERYVCAAAAHEDPQSYTKIVSAKGRVWRLSPNFRVLVPLIEDPILGQPSQTTANNRKPPVRP